MGNLSCFALLLVAIVCCTLGSSSKTIVHTEHQATKPANLLNRISAAASTVVKEERQHQHQKQHEQQQQQQQHQQQQKYGFKPAQARQKRSQQDLDVYDEYFRDMSPHAYNQALQTILQHLQTQLQRFESVKLRPRLGRSPAQLVVDRQLLDEMIDAGTDEAADDGALIGDDVAEAEAAVAAAAGLLDDIGVLFPLGKRAIIKKSVPYKPRLGKRAPTCN